jgi:hypothetical protein
VPRPDLLKRIEEYGASEVGFSELENGAFNINRERRLPKNSPWTLPCFATIPAPEPFLKH